MDDNQLGRRNLTSSQFNLLIGRKYNRTKKVERGGGDRKSNKNQSGKNCHFDNKEKTSEVIASEHGVSERTVRNAAKAAEKIDTKAAESVVQAVNKGTITLNNAAKVADMPTDTQEAIAEDIAQGTKEYFNPTQKAGMHRLCAVVAFMVVIKFKVVLRLNK